MSLRYIFAEKEKITRNLSFSIENNIQIVFETFMILAI